MQLLTALYASTIKVPLEVAPVLLRPPLRHAHLPPLHQPLLLLFLFVRHLDLLGASLEALGAAVLDVVVEEAVTPLVEGSQEFVSPATARWLRLVTRVLLLALILEEERLRVLRAVGRQRGRVQGVAQGGCMLLVGVVLVRGQDRLP